MNEFIKIVISAVLLLQGLSHGTATYALIRNGTWSGGKPTVPVRSWLLPALAPKTAAWIASVFWLLATVGFLITTLAIWQPMMADATWRLVAAASAIISLLGIGLFSGIWPGAPTKRLATIDSVVAAAIDVGVLILVLVGWVP